MPQPRRRGRDSYVKTVFFLLDRREAAGADRALADVDQLKEEIRQEMARDTPVIWVPDGWAVRVEELVYNEHGR